MAVIGACGVAGYLFARQYGGDVWEPDAGGMSLRFLAHVSLYSAGVFLIATLIETVPVFAISPCGASFT